MLYEINVFSYFESLSVYSRKSLEAENFPACHAMSYFPFANQTQNWNGQVLDVWVELRSQCTAMVHTRIQWDIETQGTERGQTVTLQTLTECGSAPDRLTLLLSAHVSPVGPSTPLLLLGFSKTWLMIGWRLKMDDIWQGQGKSLLAHGGGTLIGCVMKLMSM